MPLSPLELELVQIIRQEAPSYVENLRRLVEISSFTDDAAGVDRMAQTCLQQLSEAGFDLRLKHISPAGPHLIATRGKGEPRLLLLGHTDTVYPKEHALSGFWRDSFDPGQLRGPGVTDMKGGLVVMMAAARILVERDLLGQGGLSILLCADEETGAPTGRSLLLDEARRHDLCLVFETGSRLGPHQTTFVTERKGSARFSIEIAGVEAHAGAKKEMGLSAAEEAAHKIIALEALNDFERGTTVNVGLVQAGSAANTVPGSAELQVDCRFKSAEAGREVESLIREIATRTHIENRLESTRPVCSVRSLFEPHLPLLATKESRRAAAQLVQCSADLGVELTEEYRGGASDGNTTSEAGCPTVDGLGTVGGKIHSEGEWVEAESLADRTALLAVFAKRFFEGAKS
ncbi:MAG: M20/M25/M40 family metallo-hydrolase [Planctomycetota bacterium]